MTLMCGGFMSNTQSVESYSLLGVTQERHPVSISRRGPAPRVPSNLHPTQPHRAFPTPNPASHTTSEALWKAFLNRKNAMCRHSIGGMQVGYESLETQLYCAYMASETHRTGLETLQFPQSSQRARMLGECSANHHAYSLVLSSSADCFRS
jgi:hypothetical protein